MDTSLRLVIFYIAVIITGLICLEEVKAFPSTPPQSSLSTENTTLSQNTTVTATMNVTEGNTTVTVSSGLMVNIEDCDPTVCVEKICRVKGSISRPSFYARCPAEHPELNEEDNDAITLSSLTSNMTNYCMCSAAYHVATTSEHNHHETYVQIVPDANCVQEEKLCDRKVCQGDSNKTNKLAHICQHQEKFYCACFN